jgi:hypothetical protein
MPWWIGIMSCLGIWFAIVSISNWNHRQAIGFGLYVLLCFFLVKPSMLLINWFLFCFLFWIAWEDWRAKSFRIEILIPISIFFFFYSPLSWEWKIFSTTLCFSLWGYAYLNKEKWYGEGDPMVLFPLLLVTPPAYWIPAFFVSCAVSLSYAFLSRDHQPMFIPFLIFGFIAAHSPWIGIMIIFALSICLLSSLFAILRWAKRKRTSR